MSVTVGYGVISAETTVEIDLQEVLDEVDSNDFIQTMTDRGERVLNDDSDTSDFLEIIAERGDMINALDYIDSEHIKDWMVNNDLLSVDIFSTEDLKDELGKRGIAFEIPAEVQQAVDVLFDFFNPTTVGSRAV